MIKYQEALNNIRNFKLTTFLANGEEVSYFDLYEYVEKDIDELQRLVDKETMIRLQITNAKFMDTDGKLKILDNIERIVNGKSGEWEC